MCKTTHCLSVNHPFVCKPLICCMVKHYEGRKPWQCLLMNWHEGYWHWRNPQFHQLVSLKFPHHLYPCFVVHPDCICTVTAVRRIPVLSTETNYMLIVVKFYTHIEITGICHAWLIKIIFITHQLLNHYNYYTQIEHLYKTYTTTRYPFFWKV